MKASRLQTLSRCLAAAIFVAAGWKHFRSPGMYQRLVPPGFPNPPLLVRVSGYFEIAGGIGLLIPNLRRPAAWGLIALLIAVFPANLYMALCPHDFRDLRLPTWVYWVRLPIQPLLIRWVWSMSRKSDLE